ncbi:N-formylglutamate amidohydrolase [Serinibacter arcticus]|uniref:N-formylglutamate amidohydrolase n=1 Tax=Serinibacter arcticus TaxID=1655435 RepID=UPI0018EEAD5A|nr:N-formylglutamate amidohydrolase [Serinibacter arcticus]
MPDTDPGSRETGGRGTGVVLHVPHASRLIPADARASIVLDDAALEAELDLMTDSFTDVLAERAVAALGGRVDIEVLAAPVSRLAVDVERFPDEREEMNAVGMGAVYTRTHDGSLLRDAGDPSLVTRYADPHARAVRDAVAHHLERDGAAVLLDLHSYPLCQLPYEIVPEGSPRPEICLGVDEVHTPPELVALARGAFAGFDIEINSPFAGTYVPLDFYGIDRRVSSLMIEIRRDVYMDEASVEMHDGSSRVVRAIAALNEAVAPRRFR